MAPVAKAVKSHVFSATSGITSDETALDQLISLHAEGFMARTVQTTPLGAEEQKVYEEQKKQFQQLTPGNSFATLALQLHRVKTELAALRTETGDQFKQVNTAIGQLPTRREMGEALLETRRKTAEAMQEHTDAVLAALDKRLPSK